jgi:acetyltransferase-like isoleucine patch superfamily enzyme
MSSFGSSVIAFGRALIAQMRQERERRVLLARYPDVHFQWPINFKVDDYSALSIAPGCSLSPFSQYIVQKHSSFSCVSGKLVMESGVCIGMGANLRAAGGWIHIGRDTQIAQHVNIIASNHLFDKTTGRLDPARWDTVKTGVTIGAGCWIGAGVTILPGVVIGDGTIIGAGSIVTRSFGAGLICYGNPARQSPST